MVVEHHLIVYIPDENCYGVLKHQGAHISMVKYNKFGIDYEVAMLNEDFIIVHDITIGIEEEF